MTAVHARFLVGATASGKSSVAQRIAESQGWAILSADSMLVYFGMDIGTAKPSAAERERVPYGGVDLVRPGEPFSVWDYRRAAMSFLRSCAERGRETVVTGGSGLYVKALTHGLRDAPATLDERRQHWEAVHATGGVGALQEALDALQPGAASTLRDAKNPRRLMRALVLAEAQHAPPADSWPAAPTASPLMGLEWPPVVLARRIERRVRDMFENGFVDEVRGLLASGALSRTAAQAIGYAEVVAILDGRMNERDAMERIEARTRRLAKKQRTWFRHQSVVHWIRPEEDEPEESIAEQVVEGWREHGYTVIAE